MESTVGLADGNTYIGDINLKSEMAYQADIGFTYPPKKSDDCASSFLSKH